MAVTPVGITPGRPRPTVDEIVDCSNLTGTQFLMWLGQQLDPDIPLYNMIQTFRIGGAIDAAAFRRAWRGVVATSDAMRSTITVEEGVPRRIVAEADPEADQADVEIVDLRAEEEPETAARAWIDNRKTAPLALDERLWDTALLIVGDDAAIWYLCIHHLVTDGQSFANTYRAMSERYALEREQRSGDAPALPQYADYLAHERAFRGSRRFDRSRAYWDALVAEPHEPTEFYGRTPSRRSSETDRLVVEIDEQRCERLRLIARRSEFSALSEQLAVSTLWAAVLFTTLHRITGRTSLRVGTPFLGRPSAFRDTIGLFIEIGVLQVDIADDDTFESLARRLLRSTVDGLRHATPGASTAAVNRSFDVLLNNVTSRFDDFAGCPVTTDWVHTGYGDRDHALRLQVSDFDERGRSRLHFDVNADLFGEVEREWLLAQFDVVLETLLDDPGRRLGSFSLARDDDLQRMLVEFNATDAPYRKDASVISLFDAQAAAGPNAVAAEDATRCVTYRELADDSDAVALSLIHI